MRATLRSEVLERLGNDGSLNPPSSSLGLEAWVLLPFRTWLPLGLVGSGSLMVTLLN